MNNFEKLITGDIPILVDFSAEWCGPCKMMPPILSDLKKKVGERATIIKMDIDKNPSYARQYAVQSVPTLILFKQGKILWRKSGVSPANEIYNELQKVM